MEMRMIHRMMLIRYDLPVLVLEVNKVCCDRCRRMCKGCGQNEAQKVKC
jgi:hypothetical protein